MSRSGRQVEFGEDWTGATTVDPSGGAYTGDYYLDIQYVNDLDAGAVVLSEGTWTFNPVRWFRMPCVDPVPNPRFMAEWYSLGDPFYVKPGEMHDTALTLENHGSTALTYTMSIVYDGGSHYGWIDVSGFSGSIPSGEAGHETGTIHLNNVMITDQGNYYGHLHIEGNDPVNLPCDIEIELIIADTIVTPAWDAITLVPPTDQGGGKSLTTSNHGNMGHLGKGTGNMAFYPDDCDTTAKVYLYDGSPVVGRIIGDDTVFNSSIWGTSFFGRYGFRPYHSPLRRAQYCSLIRSRVYYSGWFLTEDTTIGVEKIYVAPEDADVILTYTKISPVDGLSHSGLVLGEAIDWDIPSDFHPDDVNRTCPSTNTGAFDPARNLLYCWGYEDGNSSHYPYNCQLNDNRFGGVAFVESYLNGSPNSTAPYGGFIGENDELQASTGLHHGKLYQEMAEAGFRSVNVIDDINTVLTYEFDFTLGETDVYEVVSMLATVMDGTAADLQAQIDAGYAWYTSYGGMQMFTHMFDGSDQDVCYHCCREMGKFYDDGMPFSILDIDNFTEWLLRNPGVPDPYYCIEEVDVDDGTGTGTPSGTVDLLDLDYMIGYLLRMQYPDLGECPTGWPKK
ncbi:MAG: hypothetical protein JSU74_02030 [Candidatus Zixiibacteriota bacterium]|nr:MAG: hypothetical protein JSU74_02030 [candidate division Zixibacteria bacterium]